MKTLVFKLTVSVDDNARPEDVAEDLGKLVKSTDGEQHLELMNFEPEALRNPVVQAVSTLSNVPVESVSNKDDLIVVVEQTRWKTFVRRRTQQVGDDYGPGEEWHEFVDELADKASRGELNFDDTPARYYQMAKGEVCDDGTTDYVGDWDEIWPIKTGHEEVVERMDGSGK